MNDVRLTQFAHGGGCGCKISPALLSQMLASIPPGLRPPQLLVGTEHADDAAAYRLNDQQTLIATTDFFTPIVDDPFDFGRIAATNALSDVYAMGGQPILALAILGMPINKLPAEIIGRILEGGASVCRDAGIPVAGGHSIDTPEPIYGLVALGLVAPEQLKTNARAQAGDSLILSKPLGIGVLSAGLKQARLSDAAYAEMLRWTTLLNRAGARLAQLPAVHAMTDVTGFGLAGHLLEICRASKLAAKLDVDHLPVIHDALMLAKEGVATGASTRNLQSYGQQLTLPANAPAWLTTLATDPQTSGGLLIACDPAAETEVLAAIHAEQEGEAQVIGRLETGTPRVTFG